jgi:hypothetical protein
VPPWAAEPGTFLRFQIRSKVSVVRRTDVPTVDVMRNREIFAGASAVGGLFEEVLGRLAHLPVTILSGPLESSVDGLAVKGSQRDDGSSADGGPIVLGGQDGGQASVVSDGTQGSDCSLAAQGVGVVRRDPRHRVDGRAVTSLTGGPRRRLDDQWLGIGE